MAIRLVVASDHGGFELKDTIVKELASRNVEVSDLGVNDETSVDYTEYAHALCQKVLSGEADRGILVCGTGMGMSMAANRHHGIRAALCTNTFLAKMSREHNDANVLCLGGRVIGSMLAMDIVDAFLNTEFEGGRHILRVQNIEPK